MNSFVSGSGLIRQRSVTMSVGPFVRIPNALRSRPVRPCPRLLKKSTLCTNARLFCRMIMKISPQLVAISEAPPLPGNRTLGFEYLPIIVLFKFPNLSTCAPLRKPKVIRPPCNQYRNISATGTVVRADSHNSPSPMDRGRMLGLVSSVPDSYTNVRDGACSNRARLHAMEGRPIPTKQTSLFFNARAAEIVMISEGE